MCGGHPWRPPWGLSQWGSPSLVSALAGCIVPNYTDFDGDSHYIIPKPNSFHTDMKPIHQCHVEGRLGPKLHLDARGTSNHRFYVIFALALGGVSPRIHWKALPKLKT